MVIGVWNAMMRKMTRRVIIVSLFSALRMIGGSEDAAPAKTAEDEVVEMRWKVEEEEEDAFVIEWIKGGLAKFLFKE